MSVDKENQVIKKLPYPKSVFFIVSNEFCERFSFYGMRTILVLYLTEILKYSDSDAKMVYHTFTMFVYFFPIFGAILSDSWLGKFNTILYVSLIYASGSILLALTAIDQLGFPQKAISIIALLLIAVGSGGIKPCVSAFGGDQFILPQQELQLAMFFSLFYFSINSGSLISTFITPILRNDVECFGNASCYPLAFAVPGILMLISIVVFTLGKPLYRIKNPKGNVFVNVVKCMTHAIINKKHEDNVEHWLDRAEPKYGAKLVQDIKALFKVLIIYIPLPIFWALYDQQGSGWTFQAVRMDGNIGFYTILPDQMQVVNPLLILAFIPLFSYGIYPALAKCNLLKTPLQRMVVGGFLAAVAFAISACVSLALEDTYPVLPTAGNAQIRIYDPTNCSYQVSTTNNIVPQFDMDNYEYKDIRLENGRVEVFFTFKPSTTCKDFPTQNISFTMKERTAYGIYFNNINNTVSVSYFEDNVAKSETGYPMVRTIVDNNSSVTYSSKDYTVKIEGGNIELKKFEKMGIFQLDEGFNESNIEIKLGGTYTVIVNSETQTVNVITIVNPNSVHMLWLLIQYFVITAAEVMFSVTGLEFAYSQAPISMKSVVQALWLLTTAFGNAIIVIIESLKIFDKQSSDFFLYTGLMLADILIFMWLAIRYKYTSDEDSSLEDELDPHAINS